MSNVWEIYREVWKFKSKKYGILKMENVDTFELYELGV